MGILTSDKIKEYFLKSSDDKLIVTPILDPDTQLGLTTIDLRLGPKFKVDLRTREPVIDLNDERPIETFFDHTYRNFGERFLLYPNQLVLASTFEYVKLPKDLFGLLITRSSWNRLGINLTSIVQPGYAGVLTLELMNKSSNPIALYVGLRLVQLCLFTVEGTNSDQYITQSISKYVAHSEPKTSNISEDKDIEILNNKFRNTIRH
ncbi:dCTP deaminase [Caenibacillus caldisaponilyticus]|uniref:dCTP deaminase n=1 Tax=Caenibacillus caldisaponilyticus TaxID=1674942 RepID=UPI00130189E6|nr:dCTP deaminase [Caenibacillus caldisaponilyticus]